MTQSWCGGTHPKIYVLTSRDSPSRFFHQYPLVKPGYARESDLEEFFADISSTPPKLIIDARNPALPPLDEESRSEWSPHKWYTHDPNMFHWLFDYVHTEYVLKEVVGGHRVYVARN